MFDDKTKIRFITLCRSYGGVSFANGVRLQFVVFNFPVTKSSQAGVAKHFISTMSVAELGIPQPNKLNKSEPSMTTSVIVFPLLPDCISPNFH